MKLTVNGEQRELGEPATVRDLVVSLGLEKAATAVEVNGKLVPRRQHEAVWLAPGDRVEVVTLVGGG